MNIWSVAYLEQDVEEYTCYVNERMYNRILNEHHTSRMFARITKDNKFWICALGIPVLSSMEHDNNIFVPQWMLEQINCNGDGEEINVDWMPTEAFDHSTKIVLQSLNQNTVENIQDVLSYEFTKLAILQKNTRIVLKNSGLEYYVRDIEPASVVLCEGDEVNLEFYEEQYAIARPPTPYPFDRLPQIIQYNDIVPSAPSAPPEEEPQEPQEPSGRILGGVQRAEKFNPWRNKDFKPSSS